MAKFTIFVIGLSDKSQEEDHARLHYEIKLQLKQPNLGWINPRFFAVHVPKRITFFHRKPPIHWSHNWSDHL